MQGDDCSSWTPGKIWVEFVVPAMQGLGFKGLGFGLSAGLLGSFASHASLAVLQSVMCQTEQSVDSLNWPGA